MFKASCIWSLQCLYYRLIFLFKVAILNAMIFHILVHSKCTVNVQFSLSFHIFIESDKKLNIICQSNLICFSNVEYVSDWLSNIGITTLKMYYYSKSVSIHRIEETFMQRCAIYVPCASGEAWVTIDTYVPAIATRLKTR